MKAFLLLAQAVSLVPVFCNPLPDSIESLEFLNEFGALEVIPPSELSRRQTQDTACRNTANTRQCWSDGFSITTDFDAKTLDTGRTVTYNLEITNSSALSPDGVNRRMMLINGQYPGPTLYANWGDRMIVNVKNSLEHNGTSIHWHGLRQLNTNQHDGVNGITECPIAPGQTKQYIIRCTQHGTSWYHSHHSAQYGDGIVGGIVINGPATSNYDTDLGTFSMTDWFHEDVFAMNWRALHSSVGPPTPESALLNGTMKTANGGKYHVTKVTKGKRFRLRLINTAVDNNFHVSIDNHNFTVIASDFVPIKPYVATSVIVNIGQRHDIIITANQDIGNYWLRADVAACAGNGLAGNVLSIIRYENATETEPTTVNTWQKPTGCYDETVRPYVNNTVPRDQFLEALGTISMDFNVTTTSSGGALVQWLINGSDIRVDWERPTLGQVLDGNFTFAPKSNVFEITRPANSWTFWIIQSVQDDPFFLVHPIHLHGHDFYVLGHAENSVWDGNVDALMFDNPPRRDTATLPAGGYLILGFPADNPGMWLMHCHIAFHVGQGLSLQFLERKDEIASAIGDLGDYEETCASWRTWWNGPDRVYEMDDSGL